MMVIARKKLITIKEDDGIKNAELDRVIASAECTLRKIYKPTERAVEHKAQIGKELKRLIAELNNEVVGTVQYYIRNKELHFLGLAVVEEQRGKGIAKKLIEHLSKTAVEKELEKLCLYTVKETGNVGLFSKTGFITVKEARTEDFVSEKYQQLHEVFMEKKI